VCKTLKCPDFALILCFMAVMMSSQRISKLFEFMYIINVYLLYITQKFLVNILLDAFTTIVKLIIILLYRY